MHRTVAIGLAALVAASGCGKLNAGSPSPKEASTAAAVSAPAAPSPRVEITQPARGAFLAPGPAAITGKVTEVAGGDVTAVEVAGQRIAVQADGSFRAMATLREGLNVLEAYCTDTQGRTGSAAVGVLAGSYKPLSEPIRNSTTARMSDATLDAVGKLAEASIWNTDWNTVLRGLNPIFDQNFLWMKVWIDIQQFRFHDVHVGIDSRPGSLLGTIEVVQPVFDVTVVADLGFARIGPFSALVEANDGKIQANFALGVRSDGTFYATTGTPATTFGNFRMTVSNAIVDAAVQLFARNAIEKAIREWIDESVLQDLPPYLDQSLAKFLQQQNPWLLLGKPFQIDIRGEHVTFDDEGVTLAGRYNATSGAPTPRAASAPGSFTTPGDAPPMDRSRGFFVATDDDGLNRTLHVMWAGGLFDVEVDEAFLTAHAISLPLKLEAGSFRRFLPEIGVVAADSAPIRIRTEACMPPIVRLAGAPDLAVLEAGEFAIEVLVDATQTGKFEKFLRAVVHVELGGNVTLTGQGLEISSLATPRFRFDLVEEPLVELDDRRLEVLLSVLMTPTIPHVMNSLRVIGIPHLNQLTTFNVDIFVDGPAREHLVVTGDMTR